MPTFAGPAIAFLFSALFFGIATRWKALRYLPWMAFAFAFLSLGLLSQLLLLPRDLGLNSMLSALLYIGATLVFSEGILRRLKIRPNYPVNFTLAILILLGIAYFFYESPQLSARVYILNFGIALILLATALCMRKGAHQFIDRALLWTLLIFALQFFPRTLLTLQHLPETKDIAQIRQYVQSPFWIWLHLSLLIFTVLIGLLLSVSIASDIITAVKREAIIDSLTTLLNRRGFEEFAETLSTKSRERRHSLILFDLDDFKAINDLHGHHSGDMVLKQIGSLLRNYVRTSDAVARLGGEEFAILLSNTPQSKVYEIAEALRDKIANIQFEGDHLRNLTVTASMGVVELQPGEAFDRAIQRADKLMYTAKRAGKNRVLVQQI